ncbi:evolutionarily conserved signaling intermediate in Toll pathway, mitochondrial [Camarhynchus parvulus]|uniref:evolutionarily conserved signaling intermediate in Toll pathway, mitochondrial n=1 Tax=Geospiza parvula TaxID=87175 RepID=UPI001237B4E3|nr:evolutionarily conserved signaling intermediate in Toll pathway, mitochondrial [Camarhynchus parvulus]
MRLGWLRALPRRLWGGPAAPELCRSLCQRPARVPSEGSDSAEGTPKPRRAPSRDPAEGDTRGGDTSGGDASGGDASGGDTSGGDASGGDAPKPPLSRLRSRHERTHGDPGGSGGRADPGAAFEAALRELSRAPPGRGGRLALVEAALAALPALGAERSLGAYNALLRLLPRGAWVPRGPVQRLLFPFPRQQECGLRLLEQMERYGVMPDAETQFLLLGVFGPRSRPMRKLQRMQFWLPRLRHLDPHPQLPRPLPPGLEAARLGLQRMACDPGAVISVIQAPVPDSGEDEGSIQPFIVSCQSPDQRELLAQHGPARPVFVEGPFPLWLRGTLLKYFVLRGDPLPPELRVRPPDPERSFYFPLHLELELERGPWDEDGFAVDRAEEGPVLAFFVCVPAGAARRYLAASAGAAGAEPRAGRHPVIFRLPAAEPPRARLGQGSPARAGAGGRAEAGEPAAAGNKGAAHPGLS